MKWQTIDNQYLGDMKFFAQLVGMWPHQNRYTKISLRLVTFFVVMLAVVSEVSRVIIFYSTDVLLDQMVYLDIVISIFVKQYHYILNAKKLKELLHEIVDDHLVGHSKDEQEILNIYFNKAADFSFVYKGMLCFTGLAYIFLPAIPPILNIIKPLNESRGRELLYPAYYFVDEERYYYLKIIHMSMGVVVLVTVYIVSDITLIYFTYHGCALLTVSGYRFKHAFDEINEYDEKDHDVLQRANAKVCRAIQGHKKAVEYMNKIDGCYVNYFLAVLAIVIIGLTFTFVRLSTLEVGSTYFTFCALTISQIGHLLFLTATGQKVDNVNDEIFEAINEAKWYNGLVKSQMLYVLVLRKCLNPSVLTAAGLVPLNLYTFVQVLKASFSYYTVFNS